MKVGEIVGEGLLIHGLGNKAEQQAQVMTMKNMPANALDNPFAKQQKVLLYLSIILKQFLSADSV